MARFDLSNEPAELSKIHKRAFENISRGWEASEFAALLALETTRLILRDAGFALLSVSENDAEILTIAVDPNSQRRGLGREILSEITEEENYQRIFLEVAADNLGAIAFYERFGFTQIARRKNYYRRNALERMDALVYEKTGHRNTRDQRR